MRNTVLMVMMLIVTLSFGCQTASKHKAAVRDDSTEKLTVGTVQKEIRIGMSSADVVGVLGSPNMVTTDSNRREVWVYDKVATERVYSTSSGGAGILGLVFGGVGGAMGSASAKSNSGASSTTQRTLTIIIKYDENGLVRDLAYRQSSF